MNALDFGRGCGANIRALRNAMHLSQEDMSLLFGVSMMTASKWERGVLVPDYPQRDAMKKLWQLADGNPHFTQAKDITREARIMIRRELTNLVATKLIEAVDDSPAAAPTKPGGSRTTKPVEYFKPRRSARTKPNQVPGDGLKHNCTNCIRRRCLSTAGKDNGGKKPDPKDPTNKFSSCSRGAWTS